jgi:hypothetical protein
MASRTGASSMIRFGAFELDALTESCAKPESR